MSVNEPERQDLYQGLLELMGAKRAETMMKLLPPTGWGDVATRKDLEAHEALTRRDLVANAAATHHQFELVRKDIHLLESRLKEHVARTVLVVNIPTVLAAVGLSFAAAKLG